MLCARGLFLCIEKFKHPHPPTLSAINPSTSLVCCKEGNLRKSYILLKIFLRVLLTSLISVLTRVLQVYLSYFYKKAKRVHFSMVSSKVEHPMSRGGLPRGRGSE